MNADAEEVVFFTISDQYFRNLVILIPWPIIIGKYLKMHKIEKLQVNKWH